MMRSVDFVELATVRMGHLFNGPLLAVLRPSKDRFAPLQRQTGYFGLPERRAILGPRRTLIGAVSR